MPTKADLAVRSVYDRFRVTPASCPMTGIGALSRPAGLRDPNGGVQQKRPLTSTTPNVFSGSTAAASECRIVGLFCRSELTCRTSGLVRSRRPALRRPATEERPVVGRFPTSRFWRAMMNSRRCTMRRSLQMPNGAWVDQARRSHPKRRVLPSSGSSCRIPAGRENIPSCRPRRTSPVSDCPR